MNFEDIFWPVPSPKCHSASPRAQDPVARQAVEALKESIETNIPVLALLQAGRAKIYAGWTRGKMVFTAHDGSKSYCALGAIGFDGDESPLKHAAGMALVNSLPGFFSNCGASGFGRVAEYNDHFAEHADILALYDRAIASLGGPIND